MNNKKVLIVGLGVMGGSIALGLHNKGITPYAIDKNEESLNYGLNKGFIQINKDAIEIADIIILCLYPHDIIKWIKENQNKIKTNTLITDISGVKKYIVEEVSKIIRKDLRYISCHPMAGKESTGVQNSDCNIFKNANLIITPFNNTENDINVIKDIGDLLNFKYIEVMDIDKHDETIGFLSQLTHAIAVSLMNSHEAESFIKYTGDSFRDLTRIAKINESLWSELFLMNKDNLVYEIDCFIDKIEELKNKINNNDEEGLKTIFKLSTQKRKLFDKE